MKNSRRRRRLKSRAKSPSKLTSANQQQLSFDQLEARHLLATLVVNSAADLPVDLSDGVVTLRDAIHAANTDTLVAPGAETGSGADTITFDGSVFNGVGDNSLIRLTEGELEITDALTIDGSTGVGVTVTGDAAGDDVRLAGNITDVIASFGGTAGASDDLLDDNSRVLNFSSLTGDLSLEGLTVTGGRTTGRNQLILGQLESTHSGGGIRFASSGALSLTNSTLSGNSISGDVAFGGGIFTSSGSVSLTNSTLSGNSTSGDRAAYGGGIYTYSGSVSLTSSTLSGNSTSGFGAFGGGIRTGSGSVSLTNSTLSGNSTSGDFAEGGGIHTYLGGSISLTNSTLSGNSTSGRSARGGGIFGGSVSLISSTLSGNSTSGDGASGGGISAGSVSLTSSTLSGNSTSGDGASGGGIRAFSGGVSLTNSTLSGNSAATGVGGGVFVFDFLSNPSFTIENSIVAGNTDNGTAPDLRPNPGSTLTINHSLIGVVDNLGTVTGDIGNLLGTLAAPIDPLLAPLADNGGPTETHALLVGSPAIDAGDPTAVAGVDNTPEFDQRGQPRVGAGRLDIGAFEAAFETALLGDVNRDDTVNFLDISPFISRLASGTFQVEADVNQDGVVSFLDISPFIVVLSTPSASALSSAFSFSSANFLTASSDLSAQPKDDLGTEFEATPAGRTPLQTDAADDQPNVRASEPTLQAEPNGGQVADGGDSLSLPNELPSSDGEGASVPLPPSMTDRDRFVPQVTSSDQGSRSTSGQSTLAVPPSSSDSRGSILAGSVADHNNGQNQLSDNTNEFFVGLAGQANRDETVDGGDDVLDANILGDGLESSEAIDEAFAELEL